MGYGIADGVYAVVDIVTRVWVKMWCCKKLASPEKGEFSYYFL